jgi:hypothetical protein
VLRTHDRNDVFARSTRTSWRRFGCWKVDTGSRFGLNLLENKTSPAHNKPVQFGGNLDANLSWKVLRLSLFPPHVQQLQVF